MLMFSVNNVSEGHETVTVTSEAVEMLLVYRWMYTQERSVLVTGNCLTSDPQIRKLNRCAAAIVRAQQVCGETCQGDLCWPACHPVGFVRAE